MITLRPVQRIKARQFVLDHHRHHGWVSGFLWLQGLAGEGGALIGTAVVGRPVARALQDGLTTEVTRLFLHHQSGERSWLRTATGCRSQMPR